jgi:hypothetical protein
MTRQGKNLRTERRSGRERTQLYERLTCLKLFARKLSTLGQESALARLFAQVLSPTLKLPICLPFGPIPGTTIVCPATS